MPEETWPYNHCLGNTDSQNRPKQLKKKNLLWMKRTRESVNSKKYQTVIEGQYCLLASVPQMGI